VSLEKMRALSKRKLLVADLRDYLPEPISSIVGRHKKIAFQFSGGKDSTAALFIMQPFWDRMTVYFCDSGDSMPETLEVVNKVKALVPTFVTVAGRVNESRAFFGWPTDILPWTSAALAHANNAGTTAVMQDRVSCCYRSVMEPMHERMLLDGITLIVRGQKNSDKFKGQFHSGDVVDGFEFLYPIQDWNDEQCFAAMREHGIEPQRFYSEGLTHSGDCLQCTAWNEDNRAAYLKKHYPESYALYANNIRLIATALETPLSNFRKELENCHADN
jgi:phosphoadenosine phosphosulfate reductase